MTDGAASGHRVPMTGKSQTVEPLPGFKPEIGLSLWTLQETRRRTLAYVDGISQLALDHNPPVDSSGSDDMDRRIPNCPPEIAAHLPYPLIMEDRSYTPVEGELLATHLERLSVIREAFLDVLGAMSLTDFRTLRPSGDQMVTPEWVVEHLSQHEAEHRGQIWEARIAAEARAAPRTT